MRKPKSPVAAWIVEQRKARGWKSEELAQRLDVAESTVRSWESGRGVSPDNIDRLERLFGVEAPGDGQAYGGDVAAAIRDQTARMEAVQREQTAAIREMTGLMAQIVTLLATQQTQGSPELDRLFREAGIEPLPGAREYRPLEPGRTPVAPAPLPGRSRRPASTPTG